ncbi:hypothetical protein A3D77_08110 [Candidatus Gottesmanbacteria bacterium RIFCSPHIGHO2_02_FULL_39_11]|uniref:PD-(D/E)XK endonuclease-like domain-containing protein n=1 Tax=Candidatus Gottesmanbacteria bacterium RIFCSPHIGHO2_02_FULL_39_11 TaxID=1798382 RepID=A0A1F5ZWV7_9BACT|nr:MAG: hypothetical protein A3D77_08110 [Candidatus Gottesmanbacteria bacterium RIFCSPHIGHO2_02_FULL_39_11]
MWRRYNSTYDPSSNMPFRISRSKIDLFIQCPRCFYLDKRLGISRPSMPGFSLNSAVDALLKKEFDLLRIKKEAHVLMKKYHIDAIPYTHRDLDIWRENFKGKEYHEPETNFIITGAIDDIWQNPKGELHIVDYKSTSTEKVISLNDKWKDAYKRQMEMYQWIFRNSGFPISETGYFVYANASKARAQFDGKLEFELSIIEYEGNDSWILPTLKRMKEVLNSDTVPSFTDTCEHCQFVLKSAPKLKPLAQEIKVSKIRITEQLSF